MDTLTSANCFELSAHYLLLKRKWLKYHLSKKTDHLHDTPGLQPPMQSRPPTDIQMVNNRGKVEGRIRGG